MARPVQSSVAARLARLGERTVGGGLLSIAETTALAGTGFEPVSEVLGATANAVVPNGFYASGTMQYGTLSAPGSGAGASVVKTYTSSASMRVGTPTWVSAQRDGYRTALARLVVEAQAVGADGVIGIQLTYTVTPGDGTQLWSFTALGTAVRATGRVHLNKPFTTDLSGSEVAAALRSGWVPVELLAVPCMAIRWVDPRSQKRRSRFAANGEVEAYTDLVSTCRRQARLEFAAAARNCRADAAVVSEFKLTAELGRHRGSCTASAIMRGTALVHCGSPRSQPPTLTILPLRRRSEGSA